MKRLTRTGLNLLFLLNVLPLVRRCKTVLFDFIQERLVTDLQVTGSGFPIPSRTLEGLGDGSRLGAAFQVAHEKLQPSATHRLLPCGRGRGSALPGNELVDDGLLIGQNQVTLDRIL